MFSLCLVKCPCSEVRTKKVWLDKSVIETQQWCPPMQQSESSLFIIGNRNFDTGQHHFSATLLPLTLCFLFTPAGACAVSGLKRSWKMCALSFNGAREFDSGVKAAVVTTVKIVDSQYVLTLSRVVERTEGPVCTEHATDLRCCAACGCVFPQASDLFYILQRWDTMGPQHREQTGLEHTSVTQRQQPATCHTTPDTRINRTCSLAWSLIPDNGKQEGNIRLLLSYIE